MPLFLTGTGTGHECARKHMKLGSVIVDDADLFFFYVFANFKGTST